MSSLGGKECRGNNGSDPRPYAHQSRRPRPGRALRFYEQVFGLREYGRGDGLVHTQASGRHDIVTFVEDHTTAGLSGGIAHFGFRLVNPDDIDRAIAEVERAGGRLLRRGEFAPGLPYAYVADPDGYEIEIWFE